MRLKHKLLLFIVVIGSFFTFSVYVISKLIIDSVVEDIVWKYAQIAVRYDAESTLATILDEVNTVQSIADHPNITSWLKNTGDEVYESVALSTLEEARWQLKSKNYFVVADETLSYYYGSASSATQQSPKHYTLEPQSVTDRWYFEQKKSQDSLRVNIATDANMKMTKIWVNQAIIEDGKFVGLVGTGIDMGLLLGKLSSRRPDALHTVFVDNREKIQLSLQAENVEYPLRNSKKTKPYLNEIVNSAEDYAMLRSLMVKQSQGEEPSRALIHKGAGNAVVAIEYIEPIQWYKITFVDINAMMPKWVMPFLYLTLLFSSFLVGVISYFVLKRRFVYPVKYWVQRLAHLANATYNRRASMESNVQRSMILLEGELRESRQELMQLVSERTAAIDKLATHDAVTKLYNRRGIEQELQVELSRAKREEYEFGLIWVEGGVDTYTEGKLSIQEYNQALLFISDGLKAAIREYDLAARWGEDEFLLLVKSSDVKVLAKIATRLHEYINDRMEVENPEFCPMIRLSVGGALVTPDMTLKQALALADSALYHAKTQECRIYIHQRNEPNLYFDRTLS